MDSHDKDILERPLARWTLYVAFWTSLGLFNVGQSYFIVTSVYPSKPFDFGSALIVGLSDWYLWAIFALVIVRLARRFPFEENVWLYSLLVHIVACLCFTLLTVAICVPLMRNYAGWIDRQASYMNVFRILLLRESVFYFWIYFAILGTCYAYDYYQRFRERELHAAQLEWRLAQARLEVLKTQLHPHFLFNTLNAISALMHKDVDLADRMLARLGELLRITLQSDAAQEVPLWQELDFVRAYLEIEQARLGPRLQVTMDVAPETLDALVPNLLLQPLVENAIRHGIAPRSEAGHVGIHAHRKGPRLEISVVDDGPGLHVNGAGSVGQGIGLANTRARLQQLFGADQDFALSNGAAAGLTVSLSLPFREGPGDKEDDRPGPRSAAAAGGVTP